MGLSRKDGTDNHRCHQQGRHHKPGMYTKFSHCGNPGHKAFMMGMVYGLRKGEQQPRHQEEHGHQAHDNCLCQNDTHIVTNPELHEHHGHHTGNRGQGAGGNFRDGLAQSHDHRVPGVLVLMLLHETVTQNDGIVHCQCQLQHHRYGVRHKAYGAEPVIGALV